jgi:PelA/Pel-15E family pectate lyase
VKPLTRALVVLSVGLLTAAADEPPALAPIDTRPFGSCIHHWRKLRDRGRFITPEPDQPSFAPSQVSDIVANILLFQRDDGGWPKDYDMTAVLTDEQFERVRGTRSNHDSSFDNGNTHSQVAYLARAVAQRPDPAWQNACERGVDFMLEAQYANGGYPQRFPRPQGYAAHITFNDGVMVGVLEVLQDVAEAAPHFRWLDDDRRGRAAAAVDRGIRCILDCQVRIDGTPTGWCQQHDEVSLEPRPARTFEPASLSAQDTAEIVRFLLRQPDPSPELVQAIESAAAWLEEVRLTGIRVERRAAAPDSFAGFDTDIDIVVVPDPQAEPIWARHYEIGTNRPVFAGRDGVVRHALADIERERRTGTAWYGGWPQPVLDRDLPAWRGRIATIREDRPRAP